MNNNTTTTTTTDVQPRNETEILTLLRRNRLGGVGMSESDLWNFVVTFAGRGAFMRTLKLLSDRAEIYKRDGVYMATTLTGMSYSPSSVSTLSKRNEVGRKEPALVVSTAPIVAVAPAVTYLKPQTKVKVPNGNIRRNSISGTVALIMYRNRGTIYSLNSILERCPGLGRLAVSHILSRLSEYGNKDARPYLTSHGTGTTRMYQWSGEYNYPFPTVEEIDSVRVGAATPLLGSPKVNAIIAPVSAAVIAVPEKMVPVLDNDRLRAQLKALALDQVQDLKDNISHLELTLLRKRSLLSTMTFELESTSP